MYSKEMPKQPRSRTLDKIHIKIMLSSIYHNLDRNIFWHKNNNADCLKQRPHRPTHKFITYTIIYVRVCSSTC